MKPASLSVALVLALTASARAEIDPAVVQLWDVVHTSEGSIVKGVIVEEIPGTSVRIVMNGGSSLVVPMASIVKITRELNPGFVQATREPIGSAGQNPAVRTLATSGFRLAVVPGMAFHTEGESGFFLSARTGWEIGLDRWGLTPSIGIDFTPDAGAYSSDGVAVITGLRAAYRGSSVSPFVGFGLGVDNLNGDTSFGITMGAGVDLIVHRRFALSAELKFHRGFGDTYTDILSYAAVGLGFEVRL